MAKTKNKGEVCITIDNMKYCYTPDDRPMFEKPKDPTGSDDKVDPRLERAGVAGFNKPKRTPNHPKKSHVVVAKEGEQVKTIRFGEQGASTAGKPKAGESEAMKKKRASFKARHGKNISKGKMSAAYWADKVKW
jgi:hypothetical protein